jgi:DNA-binding transcriptional ArsR family regulator
MAPTPPAGVIDAVFALRRALLRTADALVPPEAVLFDRTFGPARVHVLDALAQLGIPAALDEQRLTVPELARRLDVDPDALHRVLRVAQLDGLVRRDRRGRLGLTRLGRAMVPDVPGSLDPWVRYIALRSTREAYAELLGTLRTGEPSFRRAHGTTVWDWFAAHPEEERLFAEAMRSVTLFDAPALVASTLWPDEGVVCDVAGGAATLLAALLTARPGLHGVLLEAAGVLDEAATYLEDQGCRDRVELVAGSIVEGVDVRADVYVLKNILHDWDDATCLRILKALRASMPSGARLLVVEQLQPRDRPKPISSLSDLQMLTQCDGGRERSREELRTLLRRADLAPGRVERAGVSALLEASA